VILSGRLAIPLFHIFHSGKAGTDRDGAFFRNVTTAPKSFLSHCLECYYTLSRRTSFVLNIGSSKGYMLFRRITRLSICLV